MIDLSGKVVLVTGASRGIGKSIAEKFSECGASVALVARNHEALEAVAAGLPTENAVFSVDVSDGDALRKTVAEVEEKLGPLDILVNNAGITRDGLLLRMSDDDWDSVLDVNLKAAFTLTKAVTRGMMKRRSGRIINITSVVGLTGNGGQSNYAASKAGLIGFTKSVAKELGSRNVLVNAIAPGFIETDMTAGLPDDKKELLQAQIALGRLGVGNDIANAAAFLASDLSGYITGQVLVVDGGMVM
jgi:3-oxoacyl-[acyl-carrier protein] reductase